MKTKANHFLENAKKIHAVGVVVDTHFRGDERRELKAKVRDAERDNLFRAMATYCKND